MSPTHALELCLLVAAVAAAVGYYLGQRFGAAAAADLKRFQSEVKNLAEEAKKKL